MTCPAPLAMSVIVPTYNRPDLLSRCIDALIAQSLDRHEYEIIICDDGPSQAAREVVCRAQKLSAAPAIRYFAVHHTQGPAGARNVGWQNARAPLLAFTDDDTVPDPNWLAHGLRVLHTGAPAVTGKIIMPLPPKATDIERDAARLEQSKFVTANCFIRRDVMDIVGGFDERFTMAWREDSDLHFRLLRHGFSVVPSAEPVVIHPLRPVPFGAGISMQRKVMFDVLLYRNHPNLYRQHIRAHWPWFYLVVSALLLVAIISGLVGWTQTALAAALVWVALSLLFFSRRLYLSSLTMRNVSELLLTSFLIPPLSIFWRLVGNLRFGRGFP